MTSGSCVFIGRFLWQLSGEMDGGSPSARGGTFNAIIMILNWSLIGHQKLYFFTETELGN
jgi:hypothetical protein